VRSSFAWLSSSVVDSAVTMVRSLVTIFLFVYYK